MVSFLIIPSATNNPIMPKNKLEYSIHGNSLLFTVTIKGDELLGLKISSPL
jgi:hypothetical protein